MSSTTNDSKEFAKRLKDARDKRALSQTELAEKTGLVPSAIAHFEGGRRKPSFANVRSIAQALNVSADYLLGRTPHLDGATTVFRGEEKLTDQDRDWIQALIDAKTNKQE